MNYSRDGYRYRLEQRHREQAKRRAFICVGTVLVLIAGTALAFALLRPATIQTSSHNSDSSKEIMSIGSDKSLNATMSDSIVMTVFVDKNTRLLKGEDYIEAGCHATDKQNRTTNVKVETSGSVDSSKVGTYEITYTATTDDGRTNKATRNVSVEESFATTQYVPVCMYHYVYDDSNAPESLDNNWMHASTFEEELKYLSKNNYYYPSFEELVAFVEGKHTLPDKSIILTFDDAMPQFLITGVALLDKYEIPATSFVICNDSDALDKVVDYASAYVQYQSHSFSMHRGGSGIGRGGMIHASSSDEIVADQKKAADLLGTNVAYAYPFGDNNETAHEALKQAGVKCAFTIENRQVKAGDNLYALPRVRVNGSFNLATFISQIS